MTGCLPTMTHPLYGYGKQEKNQIIEVRVSEKINYLTERSTKNYLAITQGTLFTFDSIALPDDLIRCNEQRCHMTGTLYITPTDGVVGAKYRLKGDYSKAVFGYNYLYLTYLGNDTLVVTAKVSDYDDINQENSYTFTTEVNHFGNGIDDYTVAQFDFSDPTRIQSQTGNGWIPSSNGVTITYTVTHKNKADTYVNELIGLSSIKTIACKDELHKADNVLLSCIESFNHNTSVGATDARCFGSGYDPDSVEVTTSIVATTRSHNDWLLNPLEHRGDKLVTGIPSTRTFTVGSKEVNGVEYGYFELSDLYPQCNSVIISLGANCDGVYLEPLQAPVVTPVDVYEFIAISNLHAGDFGSVYVNKKYIGQQVLVTYDVETEVAHIVGDDSKLDSFEAEFIVPRQRNNSREIEYLKFYGIVTSHSEEFTTTEETKLTLEVTFVRRNGRFYDRYIVSQYEDR